MNNFLPMNPAQSWTLIALLFVGVFITTALIVWLDQFIDLAIWNCKMLGFGKGLIWTIQGYEYYAILHERVVAMTQNQVGYTVKTTDGEQNYNYIVAVTKDIKDKPKDLTSRLDSRVINHFIAEDRTGEDANIFVVYSHYGDQDSVADALNAYFDREFEMACKEAERDLA